MTRKKTAAQQETEQAFQQVAKEIEEKNIAEYVEQNYLPFSWSVCLDRALVYSTDGLKPIQRRILYTAYKNGLTDKSNKMKSATFEGEVMKYSPHGGCYSSIVNMAESETPGQPRDLRLPLVKGKGNWGSLDNGAAASRYTEMNLFPAAMELLEELNENAVDMAPNYNNTLQEPVFLPAKWPVSIIQGTPSAMAVGFSCNSPSHNPNEVMDACIAVLNNPSIEMKDLLKIVKGPDFNCGCDIIACVEDGKNGSVDGVKSYLTTGKGSFIMKAKYNLEEHNGSYTLNFYALPYKVGPEAVIESIKKKYENNGFKELASWKDLSDLKNPVNLEITTKRGVNINKVIADLYKHTPLQSVFPANVTLVSGRTPKRMNLRECIDDFLDFRKECTRRKLEYRLEKLSDKLSSQEAIQAVLVDIDKCVDIIRHSETAETAAKKLEKEFGINEKQANYILSLQLRRLVKSDTREVLLEIKTLKAQIKEINQTLSNKKKFIEFISNELEETKKKISSPRKCKIIKKEHHEQQETKQLYLTFDTKNGKVCRTSERKQDSYELAEDGKLLVIRQGNKYEIKNAYDLPEDKMVAMSRLGSNILAVAANEGYLLLVGTEGAMKLVDLAKMKLPNKKDLPKVLQQDVKYATVLRDIKDKTIVLVGEKREKEISISEVPVQAITANGKRFFGHEVKNVEID